MAKKTDDWAPKTAKHADALEDKSRDFIMRLGHASFLIQLNGVRLLTDPVLYGLPFLKRRVPLPFPIEKLRDIDYLLLSHDHRDHCDKKSIKRILEHNAPGKVLAPLKMSHVIGSWVSGIPVEEAEGPYTELILVLFWFPALMPNVLSSVISRFWLR